MTNYEKGRQFQLTTCELLKKHYKIDFNIEIGIPIGTPPKDHKFDCVSTNQKIVVECKCYSWTKTGNCPSAKISVINEAVLYLSYLPKSTKKIIALNNSFHEKRKESLAEYYYRTYSHLLKDIQVFEIDVINCKIRFINS